jgi:hypothetical protein
VQPGSAWRTLPAFVAAEAATNPGIGTLIIEQQAEGYAVRVERGAGSQLSLESTLVQGRSVDVTERDKDLATIAATLVRPSAFDPSELLGTYGIRFIILKAPEGSEASVSLANRPELVSASSGEAGQLWQVPGVVAPELSTQGVDPRANQWVLILLALVSLIALPTERRAKSDSRVTDDALPTLGEDTSDDL